MNSWWYLVLSSLIVLAVACGNAPASEPEKTFTPKEAQAVAMSLWRNDNLARHPKGSCAGCHGADFFDLARIGSTDTDLERRAIIDGATKDEAKALVQAIKQMRTQYNMPTTHARSFRPFQPGGAQLLPELSDSPEIAAVKRDIAFAQQLESLLPTLYGARIDSLKKAKQAQSELLDLINGTNAAGANPSRLNLRKLPTGILYPLWSADLHHGAKEGTFNDWVADIAHDPKPERKAEWYALQDAYLENPNNQTFWAMYLAAKDMTRVPLLGACNLGGTNAALACGAMDDFNRNKFLTALLGQHMLRLSSLGRLEEFFADGIAFKYLDTDLNGLSRGDLNYLPSNPWEIGDQGRVMLETSGAVGSFRKNLRDLGYPEFAQNSIDAARSAAQEEQDLRLTWFWIGFTFDPSLARISGSNATKVGEYMVASLIQERMFNHNALFTLLRLVAKGSLPEANAKMLANPKRVEYQTPKYIMNYSYFIGYNREIIDKEWNESKTLKIPQELKDQSGALFGRMVGNGFRMSIYLQLEALEQGLLSNSETESVRAFLSDSTLNGAVRYGTIRILKSHFGAYHPADSAADSALLEQLKTAFGATLLE
ncbi:MAG: hypothetical protein ACK41E_07720 [Deinococcales bacterium]